MTYPYTNPASVTRISEVAHQSEFWLPYMLNSTVGSSILVRSGAMATDPELDGIVATQGMLLSMPFWKDPAGYGDSGYTAAGVTENIRTDDISQVPTPNKLTTDRQIAVKLSRHMSFAEIDLQKQLTGEDPLNALANYLGGLWGKKVDQAGFAVLAGVLAQNALASPIGVNETQNDLVHDIKGASFVDGTTNINENAVINAMAKKGDAFSNLTLIIMHSVPYFALVKRGMIQNKETQNIFGQTVLIPTLYGREVLVIDHPNLVVSAGVYNTMLCSRGSLLYGQASPPIPFETERLPGAGNGSGVSIVHSRLNYAVHMNGYQWAGDMTVSGGPTNAGTTGNLAAAASWKRVFPEHKMIGLAVLRTREA